MRLYPSLEILFMSKLRKVATASFRWGWFVLLVLLAFGYMVAGLSGNQLLRIDFRLDSQTVVASVNPAVPPTNSTNC